MDPKKGKVILIGAGPGDPELLTIKAVRWLQSAQVILTDRLVSPQIPERYASPSAEIISVGKQFRKAASMPQVQINDLMVQYAKEGKLVVRLKGGDLSVYSNILDELQALTENKISYELVPGITAAAGASAYAGIPLTARGHASGVRFLSIYSTDTLSKAYWKDLAQTDDTLVFYMSSDNLPQIITQLIRNGIAPDKLLTIVEQATTPNQRITQVDLYRFLKEGAELTFTSPCLFILGRVSNLHQRFAWKVNSRQEENYFPPVAAKLVDCNEEDQSNLLTA